MSNMLWAEIEALPEKIGNPGLSAVTVVSPEITSPNTQMVVPSEELSSAKKALEERDAAILRLSIHLENALARINTAQTPLVSENTDNAALRLVREQLEKQNRALKERKAELEARVSELSKKAQLLDLENRQLVEALQSDSLDKINRTAKDSGGSQGRLALGH